MLGDLITLPIRLSARAVTLALRGTEGVLNHALAIAGRIIGSEDIPEETEVAKPQPAPATARATPPAEEPAPEEMLAVDGPDRYAQTPPEPVHVSEEPVLVEEFAEPGAEDGAGAEVRIAQPWEGYGQLTAEEVIERITAASAAEIAAIELYESVNHKRQTVLSAAERQLELINRGGSLN